ncbi:MAG: hypothetical protein ACREHD_21775 [Pirellulales bacterium]
MVTDCYSGYHAHVAGAKQKCLAHVARRAHDWQRLTKEGSAEHTFFGRRKGVRTILLTRDVRSARVRACLDHCDRSKRG